LCVKDLNFTVAGFKAVVVVVVIIIIIIIIIMPLVTGLLSLALLLSNQL
jgi:hypothetical protein